MHSILLFNHEFEVHLMHNVDAEHGSHIWPSAIVLSRYIWRTRASLAGLRVLELGCGTGLPGLLSAKLGAAKVVMTDRAGLGTVLQNVRESAEWNGVSSIVEVKELTWGHFDMIGIDCACDLILGADVFYDRTCFEPAVATIAYILRRSRPEAKCVIAYHERSSRRSIAGFLDRWDLEATAIKRDESDNDVEDIISVKEGDGLHGMSWDVGEQSVFLFVIRCKPGY
ncbi:hypothetical protein HK101_008040 [Irineochytrium annulatum]|nr:hypothetical protein HK101_008040 [Irineochytrium annulatum]